MSEKITAIIVDDEPKARSILQTMLAENCPQVTLLATAANVPEALKIIHQQQPELVFLDIEMPGYSGFQLIDMIPDANFQVIFTTAYSEYALKAFEVSAIDYLLKPIRIQKLVMAVEKALKARQNHATPQRLEALQHNMQQNKLQRLVLPVNDGYIFLNFDDIESIEGEGSYTRIYKTDGKHLLVTRLMRELETQLTEAAGFLRCHRSHIVNIKYVVRLVKADGGLLVLQSGRQIPVNKTSRDVLLQKLA